MAMAIEVREHPRFLPPQLQRFIRLRALEALGLALLAAAVVMAAALLSYDRLDPSASMASGKAPSNWLGAPGAFAADGGLRLIGLAAIVPAFMAAFWGLRFCLHQAPSLLWLRIALSPLAAMLAAAGLSALPPFQGWPLVEGLGGALGASAQNNVWQLLILAEPEIGGGAAALIAGAAALCLIFWCAAPPLGPLWTSVRWTWRALRWLLDIGTSAARSGAARGRALAAREVIDVEAVDDLDDAPAPEARPQPRVALPETKPKTPLAGRLGALTGIRSKKLDPVPPKAPAAKARKTPKPPSPPDRQKARRAKSGMQPDLPLEDGFQLPPLDLLQDTDGQAERESDAVLDEKARQLEGVLDDFGVKGEIKLFRQGPVVTLYELEPAPGVKASRVIGLADDLARNMSAVSVRVATVPGKNVIGVELPNQIRETVYLRELLDSREYKSAGALPIVLGKDISGAPQIVDLARMPHLLIAGTTVRANRSRSTP